MIKPQRSAGFTLVEVLVASAVLSLIMLALVTAMSTFGKTYDRMRRMVDTSSERREASYFLRLAMRNAVPDTLTFTGTASTISWAAPLDRAGSAGGIQFLRLQRVADALLLSFAPYQLMDQTEVTLEWGAAIDDYVLVSDVTGFTVAYKATADSDWSAEFDRDAHQSIPYLVSLNIESAAEAWPPIVVDLSGHGL